MRARSGFALMASVWLMVAIAAISLEVSRVSRDRRLAAANALEYQRALAAAQSGVEHTRARLARLAADGGDRTSWRDPRRLVDPWFRMDTVIESSVGNANYRVHLYDLASRLNLNTATETELRRYLAALHIDDARAMTIAQEIEDWIDADEARRTRGAERDDYVRQGARDVPRNAPITDVSELAGIPSIGSELLERMRRECTTIGSGQVNVNTASRAVLQTLPGFTDGTALAIVRSREGGQHIGNWSELLVIVPRQDRGRLEAASGVLLARLVYATREVGVESTGRLPGSPVHVRMSAALVRAGTAVFVTWSAER